MSKSSTSPADPSDVRGHISQALAAAAEHALRAGLAALRLTDARERDRVLGFANAQADTLLDAAQDVLR